MCRDCSESKHSFLGLCMTCIFGWSLTSPEGEMLEHFKCIPNNKSRMLTDWLTELGILRVPPTFCCMQLSLPLCLSLFLSLPLYISLYFFSLSLWPVNRVCTPSSLVRESESKRGGREKEKKKEREGERERVCEKGGGRERCTLYISIAQNCYFYF